MSDAPPSRFKAQNQTTTERLSTTTVGLVALSDFRKRRAEVIEQQEREAREAALPDRSQTSTPQNTSGGTSDSERHVKRKKKVAKPARALVSFGDDDDEGEDGASGPTIVKKGKAKALTAPRGADDDDETTASETGSKKAAKVAANAAAGVVPRAMTKAALRREAAEREALRKEFLALQAAVKATEIAIPFVFYDGSNVSGGTVRVKKGDFTWVFLDKSRKMGAELGVGGDKNSNVRREWARVGVDDLMLVRGNIIIPHHYEFYFFIINKSLGPGNVLLFDYSAEGPPATKGTNQDEQNAAPYTPLSHPGTAVAPAGPPLDSLEGANDDPTFTKVVDRRWYERNKHIYPASVWQEFDPEKDYQTEVRRDTGGNTFFFSK